MRWRMASAAAGSPWVMKVWRGAEVKCRSHPMISAPSAWAYRLPSMTTSARIGTSLPKMRTVCAPPAMVAPRVPPAW